ncbi:porin [Massilia putida]|uniref:porin n=1 Tax=Massilia putida TaxID=1141883 RepID=UPI001E4F554A|nr:porin [Massilia putida]
MMRRHGYRWKEGIAVALCAAAASGAHAQSSIRLTGLIDAYVGSNRLSGMSHGVTNVGPGGMSTSWFGLVGAEDLGDGMQAEFALTSFYKPDTGMQGRFPGDTMFSRDANIGLRGRFGAIHLGSYVSPNFFPAVRFNPFGNSTVVSPLLLHSYVQTNGDRFVWRNAIAGDTGWSNQVSYTTPEFHGLVADLHVQFGEAAGHAGKNNIGARLSYAQGPFAAAAYAQRVEVNNPLDAGGPVSALNTVGSPARQSAWFVGATYDFTAVKLFGTFQKTANSSNSSDKTGQLGASAPVGRGAVLLSWANTRRLGNPVGGTLSRNTVSFGYDYLLSKRVDLYVVGMFDKVTAQERATTAIVGLRQKF